VQALAGSWKKVLHYDVDVLGLTPAEYDTTLQKLASFDEYINHIEGVVIKFAYK
jgi:hypothetical protein